MQGNPLGQGFGTSPKMMRAISTSHKTLNSIACQGKLISIFLSDETRVLLGIWHE